MQSFSRISPQQAKQLMDNGTVAIADVRDRQSYAMNRIQNATHLDNGSLPDFLQHVDEATPVIVCCYHGHMSQGAASFLVEQGYGEVYSLDGGFQAWSLQYPEACEAG